MRITLMPAPWWSFQNEVLLGAEQGDARVVGGGVVD